MHRETCSSVRIPHRHIRQWREQPRTKINVEFVGESESKGNTDRVRQTEMKRDVGAEERRTIDMQGEGSKEEGVGGNVTEGAGHHWAEARRVWPLPIGGADERQLKTARQLGRARWRVRDGQRVSIEG